MDAERSDSGKLSKDSHSLLKFYTDQPRSLSPRMVAILEFYQSQKHPGFRLERALGETIKNVIRVRNVTEEDARLN